MTVEGLGYTIICAAFGVASTGYGLHQRRKMRASENWQGTTGTIRFAGIRENKDSDSIEYEVWLDYEYVAGGAKYMGNRIELGRRTYLRKRRAERELDRYPVHSSVTVFFNPENPKEAVLERKATDNPAYLVMGIFMLGFAVALLVLAR